MKTDPLPTTVNAGVLEWLSVPDLLMAHVRALSDAESEYLWTWISYLRGLAVERVKYDCEREIETLRMRLSDAVRRHGDQAKFGNLKERVRRAGLSWSEEFARAQRRAALIASSPERARLAEGERDRARQAGLGIVLEDDREWPAARQVTVERAAAAGYSVVVRALDGMEVLRETLSVDKRQRTIATRPTHRKSVQADARALARSLRAPRDVWDTVRLRATRPRPADVGPSRQTTRLVRRLEHELLAIPSARTFLRECRCARCDSRRLDDGSPGLGGRLFVPSTSALVCARCVKIDRTARHRDATRATKSIARTLGGSLVWVPGLSREGARRRRSPKKTPLTVAEIARRRVEGTLKACREKPGGVSDDVLVGTWKRAEQDGADLHDLRSRLPSSVQELLVDDSQS